MRLRNKYRCLSFWDNMYRTGLMLADLDYSWHREQAGFKRRKDNTVIICSAPLQCWTKCELQILWLSGGALWRSSTLWSAKDSWMHYTRQDLKKKKKEILPQGRSVNVKHKRAIIIVILITIIITSIPPLLHSTQCADADLRCSAGRWAAQTDTPGGGMCVTFGPSFQCHPPLNTHAHTHHTTITTTTSLMLTRF